MRALPIVGDYPPDWPEIADRVRESVNHRCVRCRHPYHVGKHGKGQWSPCDGGCQHAGPLGELLQSGIIEPLPNEVLTSHECQRALKGWIVAEWRILTVHHLDGNKANCSWWNLLPVCQRCHLTIQSRVNPDVPYFLEHSGWFRPYVAGFYAKKYEGREITRQEADSRIVELLAYEQLA